MALWVDEPIWPAHGRTWAHLISDTSVDELHRFADRVGLRRGAFEGDHYDVPDDMVPTIVAAGAQPTTGRDLMRRLLASGLRLRKRAGDTGISQVLGVRFADGSRADVDLVASGREMEQHRVFAATVFISDRDGNHLLTWSQRRSEWSACGGWREPGELPLETAVRETEEESGLILDGSRFIPVGYEVFHFSGDPWVADRDVMQVYRVDVDGKRPVVRAENPGEKAPQWVDDAGLEEHCRDSFWWPLARRVVLGRQ